MAVNISQTLSFEDLWGKSEYPDLHHFMVRLYVAGMDMSKLVGEAYDYALSTLTDQLPADRPYVPSRMRLQAALMLESVSLHMGLAQVRDLERMKGQG